MTASVARNPWTRSKSSPGVRIVTASGEPPSRISSGSSAATVSGRVLCVAPRMRSTGVRLVTRPTRTNGTHAAGLTVQVMDEPVPLPPYAAVVLAGGGAGGGGGGGQAPVGGGGGAPGAAAGRAAQATVGRRRPAHARLGAHRRGRCAATGRRRSPAGRAAGRRRGPRGATARRAGGRAQ